MALTPERKAQMDAILAGSAPKLTPERRAQMDAVLGATQEKPQGLVSSIASSTGIPKALATGISAIKGLGTFAGEALKPGPMTHEQYQNVQRAATAPTDFGMFGGKQTPIGADISATEGVGSALTKFAKPVIGTGLQIGSLAAPVEIGAGMLAKGAGEAATPFLARLGGKALRGVGAASLTGGLMSGGGELARPGSTAGSVLAETGKGALAAAPFGLLPAAGMVAGKTFEKAAPFFSKEGRAAADMAGRGETLKGLSKSNKSIRNVVDKNSRYGVDVEKIVGDTTLLNDAVDKEGRINTAPAIAKIEKKIEPYEDVVRRLLEREGTSVDAPVLESSVMKSLDESGILGADLERAKSSARREIRTLLKKHPDGRVPLTEIHDLKIYKGTTKAKAFMNPSANKADIETIRALRKFIEDHSSEQVRAVNKELQQFKAIKEYLEALGKYGVVKGGRLGKYFAKTAGTMLGGSAGAAVGGPGGAVAGGIVGSEIAELIQSQLLRGTFGKGAGKELEIAEILKRANQKAGSPRLALPAGTPGGPTVASGPTIFKNGPTTFEPGAKKITVNGKSIK